MNDAKIIAITQPLINKTEGPMSAEEFLAYTARVSNPSNQNNTLTAPKLLKYLIKHRHWSPFEMLSVTMDINTTRDISHQIIRHRSFSFQEFSQRYADPTKELDFVLREARLQDTKNRQNSVELDYTNDDHRRLAAQWEVLQNEIIRHAKNAYTWAIDKGIAKEQARVVLPEGNTVSKMYMNGTLRSWVHFIELRSANGTQKEHRQIAVECAKVIAKVFPMVEEFITKE